MANRLFKDYTEAEKYTQSLNNKISCRVGTTGNITLSNTQTIDGIPVVIGDRVLVKNQTIASENGIYVCYSGGWHRSPDMDTSSKCRASSYIFIEEGTSNANKLFQLTTDNDIILGTTDLTFAEYGVTSIIAGNGLKSSESNGDVIFALDLAELTESTVTPSTDSIVFIDSTDDSSKKSSVVNFVSGIVTGDGLNTTNGQLSLDMLDEDNMASDSNTKVATQQSIKAYVDGKLSTQNLDFRGDSGGIQSMDLDSNTLILEGDTGIDTTGSTNKVSFAIDSTVATLTGSQILTNKTLTSVVLDTGVSGSAILDEDDMSSNSSTQLATQQSIKAYADTKDISLANTNYLSVTGQQITGNTIPVSSGGTGSTTAEGSRTNLGLSIGSDVQAYDSELNALAGLTSSANKIPMFSGLGTATTIDFKDEDDMNSNSATAVASQQSIKAYVDSVASGLDVKASCRVATTSNITLSNTQTIDGVAIVAGNRVLVKDQSSPSDNGIYVCVDGGSWTRATDFDDLTSDNEVTAGAFTFIEEGTTNANAGFVLTTNNDIILGTTDLSFTQFSGAGQITAGDGIAKSGNTLSIDAKADSGIVIDSTELSLNLGASNITGTLAISDGGTGATTAEDARTNLDVDQSGTDNSTPVTLANTNYLSISGQEITGGTVPVGSGGTGATTAAAARTNLGVDAAGTDNSTNVTLASVTGNYLSISGQEITAGNVPISLGGTGATTAAAARAALGVDAAGTDNSTDVTLANTNYLSISGQEITAGTVPIGSGGTGATTVAAARSALGVDAAGTDNSTNVTLASVTGNYLSINSSQVITAGTVPVSLGGTGKTTLHANGVLLGNGTNAVQSGSSLTFNGSELNISGHIIPNASDTYDLGSATNNFRDLYLSGSTIRLGNTKISTNSDGDIEFMDKNDTTRRKLMVDELIIGSGDDKVTLRKDSSNKLEIKTRGNDDSISDNNIEIKSGGTGATTASGARTNLGLGIGTDVQAYDAGLTSIAGLTTAADKMIYTTVSDTYATTSLTSFARTLLDDSDASTARTTLGAGTVTSVGGTGTVNGLTLSGSVSSSGNLTLGGTLAINNSDWSGTGLSVANGGTGQTTYSNGELLIGNGNNTLTKSTLTEGSNITITNSSGSITISSTDTNTTYSVGDNGLTEKNFTIALKNKLDSINDNKIIDWTSSGAGTIHSTNYTNTMGSGFVLEDGDGTEVIITENKEVKFINGSGININWTDGDPYDLSFSLLENQTTITSIYNSSLKIGTATNQEYISFSTSDEVNTFVNNTERLSVTNSGVDITGNLAIAGTITGDTSLTLDSTTITVAELGVLDGVTAGTASALKALVLNASGNISGLGTFGCGAITSSGEIAASSLDISGDVDIDGTLEADAITIQGETLSHFVSDKINGRLSSISHLNILSQTYQFLYGHRYYYIFAGVGTSGAQYGSNTERLEVDFTASSTHGYLEYGFLLNSSTAGEVAMIGVSVGTGGTAFDAVSLGTTVTNQHSRDAGKLGLLSSSHNRFSLYELCDLDGHENYITTGKFVFENLTVGTRYKMGLYGRVYTSATSGSSGDRLLIMGGGLSSNNASRNAHMPAFLKFVEYDSSIIV